MGEAILALLGGTLFIPLAVAYLVVLASGLVMLFVETGRGGHSGDMARE